MSEPKDDDSFLSRWSRRKIAAREGEALPAPKPAEIAPAAPAAATATDAPAEPELPPVESLEGLKSDYRAFMQPGVDEDVKRAAIKKLFTDPHFNVMDGLDVYIDDYTNFEPLPADMLGKIAAVKYLFRAPEADREADATQAAAVEADTDESGAPIATSPGDMAEAPAEARGGESSIDPGETISPDPASLNPLGTSEPEGVRNRKDSW